MKPEMTVHAIKLRFICDSSGGGGGAKMQSARTNLGVEDAIEYGGGGYGESR